MEDHGMSFGERFPGKRGKRERARRRIVGAEVGVPEVLTDLTDPARLYELLAADKPLDDAAELLAKAKALRERGVE